MLPVVNTGGLLKNYTTYKGGVNRTYKGCIMSNWKGFVMDNTNITTTTTDEHIEGSAQTTQTNTSNSNSVNAADETITMSKSDYDKAIQSAEDRVRTKYTKDIKALEEKVASLTPPVKTDKERAFEQRLADLEKKEKEAETREKTLKLKTALQSHNIDVGIADYLNPDIDAEAFSVDIEKIVTERLAAGGYKPTGHQTNKPISKAEYDKLSYDEKAELYRRDPDAWKRLKN